MSRLLKERNAGLLHVAARRAGLAAQIDHAARRAGRPHVAIHHKEDPAQVVAEFTSVDAAIEWLGKEHHAHA